MKNFQCPKCSNIEFEKGEIRTAGGFWSKIFDVQNKKFISISCTKCGFTEFYKEVNGTGEDIFDFFTS